MNLKEKISEIREYYSPKIVGEVNDVFVKLVKIKGNKVPWHTHENEDELFYIVEGSLLIEIENKDSFTMDTGDLFIIPKGVRHRVSSQKECSIMLIENKTTAHTGTVEDDITKSIEQQL